MENRLYLNKKPVYILPDEIIVGQYTRNYKTPNFEPDLILNSWGNGRFCSIGEKFERAVQIWIKTDNEDLIEFIKGYDYNSCVKSTSMKSLSLPRFKQILLKEYYGK